RLPLLLLLVLAVILLWRGYGLREAKRPAEPGPVGDTASPARRETVSFSIDFGNGQRKEIIDVAWHDHMTVADALRGSKEVSILEKGSGEGGFLTAIDDVTNEGAAGKNWTYEVNGKSADRSFAVYELRPGDRVLWTFGLPR
ncbi:MAG TPA: DUF4430 domain-containing protein, partial [Lacipirellulaceae bacterium]|nr:DUF4430 domain-containing protein [Lacipirellulaceae bacterium]